MRPFLTTEHLVLRALTNDDVYNLFALDSDPEVMRYLTNGKPTPRHVVPEYIKTPGRWAAEADGEFIGWFALRPSAPDEAELGYRLRRCAWGKGYATEGSRALVRKGFTELGLRRIWAQTMAVNLASRRVMEKAGLSLVRTFFLEFDDPIPGTEYGEVEYALDLAGWLDAEGSPGVRE